jgi:hypothetical protein
MMDVLRKYICWLLSFTLALYAIPGISRGEGSLQPGARTAEEAAAADANALRTDGLGTGSSVRGSYAFSDTTEYEFPEEEKGKHLTRDIAVFVVLSAFVGFFIIKVFLEGEKDEPPAPDGGKDTPLPSRGGINDSFR